MNKQNHTTHSEIVTAKPLVLRLNWWRNNEEVFLQSIDMLWTEALGDKAEQEEYQPSKKLSKYGEQIQEGLENYVTGNTTDRHAICANIPLFWQNMPPFRKRVLQALYHNVGYGQTMSYGQLAALADSPKAARAVGSAMSANPWPLIVP